nr:DNA topoisomerase [uncultured Sellimonas sp.]
MGKSLYIAEKPSVAQEFAKALQQNMRRRDGWLESDESIVTWCVGHLVTMSYPEAYDPKYKKWSLSTLPFLPKEFKYEVIPNVKKQFDIVSGLLNREDVDTIYVCTDSGREGEYIYRLVEQMAGVRGKKKRKRVWIDSQTEEEILRGIREAKDLSAYDNLSDSAYLRAKEDYLMGINFSRLLTLKYGNSIAGFLHKNYVVLSAGRVMTCVLGMVVRREREIREFVKTPFYRVLADLEAGGAGFTGEWKAVKGSRYEMSPKLYRENGFKERKTAQELIDYLSESSREGELVSIEKKKEKKNPPLLFNLAELQNECSKRFKISPDETLRIVQELYEKKLVTYPRTDARVLSTAVAKEIHKNLNGLAKYEPVSGLLGYIARERTHKGLEKTRYVNDSQITDHYAIIPTGQGLPALKSVSGTAQGVYDLIVKRFLSIFYPPAVYQKVSLEVVLKGEHFFSSFKVLTEEGFYKVTGIPGTKKGKTEEDEETVPDAELFARIQTLRKGDRIPIKGFEIKEGETSPPKRYNSGSMILAMENAGQLIEDEELRAQIKGSGIGTSATRAEILKKLIHIKYLSLNKKTQVITPTLMGELIYDAVDHSIRSLLNPELTASWEKGLTLVAEGKITSEEYMQKLEHFIIVRTNGVIGLNNQYQLKACYDKVSPYYKSSKKS